MNHKPLEPLDLLLHPTTVPFVLSALPSFGDNPDKDQMYSMKLCHNFVDIINGWPLIM